MRLRILLLQKTRSEEDYQAWSVVYHKDTKVMYVVTNGEYNGGTYIFTLLVDAQGRPMLWDE